MNPFLNDNDFLVEVVVINYKRPENIEAIIKALRAQTVRCKITICEAAPDGFELSEECLSRADRVVRVGANYGSFNRFCASFTYHCPYTYFHDDDMLPGPRLLEGFLHYRELPYTVLGQEGRRFKIGGFSAVKSGDTVQPVDFVCRGYWVETKDIVLVLKFLWSAWTLGFDIGFREDDILLAQSIKAFTGRAAYVVPQLRNGKMNHRELPAPHAMWKESDHTKRRLEFVKNLHGITRGMRKAKGRIIVASAPPVSWRNLGDHAQYFAIILWLRSVYPDRIIITVDKNRTENVGQLDVGPDDILYFVSGGNMGDRGHWSESGRRKLVSEYPDLRIVILQQTVSFGESETGREQLRRSVEVYEKASNLTIFARDNVSFNRIANILPNVDKRLAPDFTLFLDGYFKIPLLEREGGILIIRSDNESVVDAEMVEAAVVKCGIRFRNSSTVSSLDVTEGMREYLLFQKIAELSAAEVVITDRMHGVIFSYLARTPCVVLPSIDHKLESLVDWFEGISAIQFAPTELNIPESVRLARCGSFDHVPNFPGLLVSTLGSMELRSVSEMGESYLP